MPRYWRWQLCSPWGAGPHWPIGHSMAPMRPLRERVKWKSSLARWSIFAERSLFAPDLRVNYGFAADWEASLEGDVAHGLTAGTPASSVIESQALLKHVLREGVLQEKTGPSIATEFGILLPGINDEPGTGAVLTGIASQRWDWGTVHLNAQIELTREQHADYFLDTIVEGPYDWVVRPVSEIFYERDIGLSRTRSVLIGAIWQAQDNIAVDFGLRGALVNDHTVGEIRAGVTFAFGVTKGPDILSRLFATALRGVH